MANGWEKSLVGPLMIGKDPAAAVVGESPVPMIQTVLPGTAQDCNLSGSPWNWSVGTPTHSPVAIPSGAYSNCDAFRVP